MGAFVCRSVWHAVWHFAKKYLFLGKLDVQKIAILSYFPFYAKIGNHVDGEYRHGGSNPPLSAKSKEPA